MDEWFESDDEPPPGSYKFVRFVEPCVDVSLPESRKTVQIADGEQLPRVPVWDTPGAVYFGRALWSPIEGENPRRRPPTEAK